VNSHYNARLTAWGRAELVHRIVKDDEPVAVVVAALHVSRSTIYKWLRRFEAEGWPGLLERSSRPHRSPRDERARPGKLFHVDTKALDRFQPVGHRIHGNRSKLGPRRGLGQNDLHVAISLSDSRACHRRHKSAR